MTTDPVEDLENFRIDRYDNEEPPLRFTGKKIATCQVLPDDAVDEYEDLDLYWSRGGSYVLHIVTRSLEDDHVILQHVATYRDRADLADGLGIDPQLQPLRDAAEIVLEETLD